MTDFSQSHNGFLTDPQEEKDELVREAIKSVSLSDIVQKGGGVDLKGS